MITALFVRRDSIYKELGLDCYDADKDARTWPGGNAIICHPPCRAWGQLSHMAKPRPDEKDLAVYSINQIRIWGGVLEHPKASKLWKHMGLPKPGTYDEYGGFSLCVDQSWWGHLAKKSTMLYICGIKKGDLPNIPISFNAIEYTVSSKIKKKTGRRIKKEIPKSQREVTPKDFALWLIEVAKNCKQL